MLDFQLILVIPSSLTLPGAKYCMTFIFSSVVTYEVIYTTVHNLDSTLYYPVPQSFMGSLRSTVSYSDGSVVKSTDSSSKGTEFKSHQPVAHDHPQ